MRVTCKRRHWGTLGCQVPVGPGLHKPDVVGLGLRPGWWPTCPVQGEAPPLPRGRVLFIRHQEQFRVLAKGSERVHQSVT